MQIVLYFLMIFKISTVFPKKDNIFSRFIYFCTESQKCRNLQGFQIERRLKLLEMYCRKMQNIFFYILAINSNQLIFFILQSTVTVRFCYILKKKVLAILLQLYKFVLKFYSEFIVALLRKLNLLKSFEKNATIILHHHVT